MHRAGDILSGALRRLAKPGQAEDWLRAAWPVLVGERFAARAVPVGLRDGRLEIVAPDREWRDAVEASAEELRARINRAWGSELVRRVNVALRRPEPSRAVEPAAHPAEKKRASGRQSRTPRSGNPRR